MNDGSTLAILAGMLAGFFAIAKIMLSQASKDRDADRDERKAFAVAIEHMAKSSARVADTNADIANAVKQQAKESEKRNGHLGDMITEQGKQTQLLAESVKKDIISAVKVQHVDKQEVAHQHIEKKEK